jgi:hypothetical protein
MHGRNESDAAKRLWKFNGLVVRYPAGRDHWPAGYKKNNARKGSGAMRNAECGIKNGIPFSVVVGTGARRPLRRREIVRRRAAARMMMLACFWGMLAIIALRVALNYAAWLEHWGAGAAR